MSPLHFTMARSSARGCWRASQSTPASLPTTSKEPAIVAGRAAAPPTHGANGVDTSTRAIHNQPPEIAVNGNNPATVQVGVSYLSATFTGPQQDLNLDISAQFGPVEE